MAGRKARSGLSPKLRFEVFKRDKFTCQYCGRSAPEVVLQADHIKPVSKQGDNEILNLITSCKDCNAGKSDRELSDDAVLQKRKAQLDELQERREQIEMMLEWQRGLASLKDQEVETAAVLWSEVVPHYSMNENGRRYIKKFIGRFGLQSVLESMRLSAQQYLVFDGEQPTAESVVKTFQFIANIAATRQLAAERPYLQELYYIRGIMRNRFTYCNQWIAMELMEKAYGLGVSVDQLRRIVLGSRNWSQWHEAIDMCIADYADVES